MPKWKLFLWKLGHNSIATKGNLAHRHISNTDQCPICFSASEDCQHLFRDCDAVQVAWTLGQLHIDPRLSNHITFVDWLINWILYFRKEDGVEGTRLPCFVGLLWSIWGVRNDHIFRQHPSNEICFQYRFQETQHRHSIFMQDKATEAASQPTHYPPGFIVANIGRHKIGQAQLRIQTDGA